MTEEGVGERTRIVLWGATGSGKTTYLAALPIAAMQDSRQREANWLILGTTDEAARVLTEGVSELATRRTFPADTSRSAHLSWSFRGRERSRGWHRRFRDTSFVLELPDTPGESFLAEPESPTNLEKTDAEADDGVQGVIYLFDPLGDADREERDLRRLVTTLGGKGQAIRAGDGRLPHYVSVCITKFDRPDLFRPAAEAGWVTQDEDSGIPRIPGPQAEAYFHWLCEGFRSVSARLLRDCLTTYFEPDRISYYVTSAIGFRLNAQHGFDYRNYANVELIDGQPRISTVPHPINVMEPLTELEFRIRTADGARGRRRG
ncbi:hypothetical protein [Streptomyces mangrovisoli]|uniref:hypothetical protein n=1 Tax=Streptomyces mangrovisoli TaxID=1428628 RepID=UPI001160633F|nr:hypothetical protein [Streptomyces mangrovisoli]